MATLAVKDHRVFFERTGTGAPVCLLHGGGSNARQWKALVSALSYRFTCVTPDFCGHRSSPHWPDARSPTLEDYADIVDALIDDADRPFHLVGHSHGGAVAITYAVRNPQALSSLTLIEPTLMHLLRIAGEAEVWREAERLGLKHIAAIAAGEAAAIADEFLPYWIGEAARRGMPEARRAAIVQTMPAVAQFWESGFAETTPTATYAELRVPTLLIRGSATRSTAHDIVEILGGLLPDARSVEIEGAGHMAPLTHADQVNAAVVQHILQKRVQR